MSNLDAAYRFLKGFVYPAVLGAGLAWWIQALATRLSPPQHSAAPEPWFLWFGGWFIAYEVIWYWFLLMQSQEGDKPPPGYSERSVCTDFIDVIAVLGGFVALGFASGNYETRNPGMVYVATAVLVASAAFANFPRWKATLDGSLSKAFGRRAFTFPVPFFVAIGVPLLGTWIHLIRSGSMSGVDVGLLAVLYLVLGAYFVAPEVFSSHRDPPKWQKLRSEQNKSA